MMNFLSVLPIEGDYTIFVDLSISAVLIGLIVYFLFKYKLSTKVIVVTSTCLVLFVLSGIFGLDVLRAVTIGFCFISTVYVSLLLSAPEREIELRRNKKISQKESSLTDNETDELIANLQKAINALSSTQTGALITVERSDDLSAMMLKSGTKVNAPVTPEILETIFYKGTPLHDGATIIRGNMVITSAVFYQPTQRALNGKYGSRHRAAIGISEICDALTIVVSEETGRVSLAYKGELVSVPVAQFSEKFKEYYLISEKNGNN